MELILSRAVVNCRRAPPLGRLLVGGAVAAVVVGCGGEGVAERATERRGDAHLTFVVRTGAASVVELPRRATGSVLLSSRDSEVAIGFTLDGAGDVSASASDDRVVYPGATSTGGDWVHHAVRGGTEDAVHLPAAPAQDEVRYRVDVSKVPGVRLVSDVVEFLDRGGAPIFRMSAPALTDARRRPFVPRVSIEGCDFDSDPRGPWRRGVTSPGASSCTVAVSWRDHAAEVVYPAILDPVWIDGGDLKDAGGMLAPRSRLTATVLSTDTVLVAGGLALGGATATTELYDVFAHSWAATAALPAPRYDHVAVPLPGGEAIVIGGFDAQGKPLNTAERYANGAWTETVMNVARARHAAALLADGRILVTGGTSSGAATASAEIYDPATPASWTPVAPMKLARSSHSATALTDGRVLVAGGYGPDNIATLTAELFDPSAGWTQVADMPGPHAEHTATLAAGRIVVVGGVEDDVGNTGASIVAFDPTTSQWSPPTALVAPRMGHSATLLESGKILVAGGTDLFETFSSVELISPGALTTSPTVSMSVARESHASALLGSGQVLVAGGYDGLSNPSVLASTELYGRDIGGPCAGADDCGSGFCIDGVCCDTDCAGRCMTCLAAEKEAGKDGVCGPVALGTDPASECPTDLPASCSTTGVCDGQGECAFYQVGLACAAPSCSGASLTTYACSADHGCASTTTSCAPYACSGQACLDQCTSDVQCVAAAFCGASQTCVFDLAAGTSCTRDAQCSSGFCVDGLCCNTKCDGICQACTAAATGGIDGLCANATEGQDPHDDCDVDLAVSCQRNGVCNGAGACEKYAAGTPCGDTTCVNGAQIGYACNGTGTCLAGTSVSCAPGLCTNGACADCGASGQCDSSGFCDTSTGKCVFKYDEGAACDSPGVCRSGYCADGHCCNTDCSGQCEACDVDGAEGICVPVEGAPRGGRPACPVDEAANPCSARQCDGRSAVACDGYVGSSVSCRQASCDTPTATATLGASCDGKGSCPDEQVVCEPYACGADACLTSCADDTACVTGATCDRQSGQCRVNSTCDGQHTTSTPDGVQIDCSPYVCDVAGFCKHACATPDDCVAPNACNGDRRCVPPPPASGPPEDGGCSCGVVASDRGFAPEGIAALVLLGMLGRRRRRRRGSSRATAALAAALAGAAGGCSSDGGDASAGGAPLVMVTDSQTARRIAALRRQFRALPSRARAFIGAGEVDAFEPFDDQRLFARMAHGASAPWRDLTRVEVPRLASEAFRLERRGKAAIEAAPLDVRAAPLTVADGLAFYEGAFGDGFDLVRRIDRSALEDYVVLPHPGRTEVRYEVDVSAVAGLRLVENALELLDRHGAPVWRLAPPYLVDGSGVVHPARIEPRTCAVDVDRRPPWGRDVVAPGAARCVIAVVWSDVDLAYPALLDPSWTSGGALSQCRYDHAAVALADGRVLVVGGTGMSGDLASTEIFDGASSSWTSVGGMSVPRTRHTATVLPNGRVLVAGGRNNAVTHSSAEVFDPSSSAWSLVPPMAGPRALHTATLLSNGALLVAGGSDGTAALASGEIYDPNSPSWVGVKGAMSSTRVRHAAARVQGDKVIVAGGDYNVTTVASADVFDAATASFAPAPAMSQPRSNHVAVSLPDGRALIAGGAIDASAEIFDPLAGPSGGWSPAGTMSTPHSQAAAVLLDTGRVLVTGGRNDIYSTDIVDLFDATTNAWSVPPPPPMPGGGRQQHTATRLGDGRVVVTGGNLDSGFILCSTNVYALTEAGGACASDDDCHTGYCADGVCCDSSCIGLCMACTAAKKGGGADGTCAPIAAGTDPDFECLASASKCQETGFCDGSGACELTPVGTPCGGTTCAQGILSTLVCDGQHACTSSPVPCAPYVCATAGSCATACGSDLDCDASAFCAQSTCQPKKALGQPCFDDGECMSAGTKGFCVEGVCCDSACTGSCQSCRAATKASGSPDGTCEYAKAGTDPHDTCADQGQPSCQQNGLCDGQGSCQVYLAGAPCGPTSCVGNQQTGFACNGLGTCLGDALVDCGLYLCTGGACKASCATSADCVADAWCNGNVCEPRSTLGAACTSPEACSSHLCVDGVCCNAPCAGQCEACNVEGNVGTCAPVVGAPPMGRAACAAPPDNPCGARTCNGVERTSCAGYVGVEVTCRQAKCEDGIATAAAECDGHGVCPALVTAPCLAYACGATQCKTSCASADDCAADAVCNDQTAKCIIGTTCDGDHTIRAPDGETIDCAPYRCQEDGKCATVCSRPDECVSPAACDQDRKCTAPPDSGDGGCACRAAAPSDHPASRTSAAILFAALACLRRIGGCRRRGPRKRTRRGDR